ncbi:lactate utilization protein [Clostridium botulinum]|uniref:Transcriptional regulators of sugar metabolism n=1 Tax=Clostridium botulinum B str. Osaka05 TaxID=1407017 RepID=A0A0S6U4Q6_CLOBO|nr:MULTISPECIES: lactate utilization protein [Clostridium]EKO1911287.1 lactate utilization protein [Clostridium botulinum]EKO2041348.1 lactate utilization protein [Clostridium botulinum]MBW5455910.1 lactate utilization protein [Clostridium sporogenes]GAE01877.1 transcriptional regulators of sugar metabolism [Clostridium botulinum B str. Osaka05]HDK7156727.1 lactate utilization protein [Clostridium botulinum]
MDKNVAWYIEKQAERTIKNLNSRNMEGYYINNIDQLFKKLKELIPEGSIVGVGDSMTLFEAGVIDFLRSGNFNFLDKYQDKLTSDEKREIYINNFSTDTFICSTNAITESGELYNIDGNGSRVAPMIYGPKQVILIVGINKIVKNIEEAESRVRSYAAPIDAKRLNKDTPCTKLGYCVDCKSPNRICNDFVVIRGQFIKGRIKVLILGENLGY